MSFAAGNLLLNFISNSWNPPKRGADRTSWQNLPSTRHPDQQVILSQISVKALQEGAQRRGDVFLWRRRKTDIGKRQSREYLLESIVNPNAKIATGFETVIVTLKDGTIQAGILKAETATELTLTPPSGAPVKLKKAEVQKRESGPSGMPPLSAVLTRREIRDLVEYLASLK